MTMNTFTHVNHSWHVNHSFKLFYASAERAANKLFFLHGSLNKNDYFSCKISHYDRLNMFFSVFNHTNIIYYKVGLSQLLFKLLFQTKIHSTVYYVLLSVYNNVFSI